MILVMVMVMVVAMIVRAELIGKVLIGIIFV